MKNRKMELTAKRKTLAEVKIFRGIFQEDVLLLLILAISVMLLNYKLKTDCGSYKLKKRRKTTDLQKKKKKEFT